MTTEPEPATKVITIERMSDFKTGDVIVNPQDPWAGPQVRRVVPPKPKLPTTNGSIVAQPKEDFEGAGLVSAFLVDGTWWDTTSPTSRLMPGSWLTGWALVYEAPALLTDRSVLLNLVSALLYRYDHEEGFGVVAFTDRLLALAEGGK